MTQAKNETLGRVPTRTVRSKSHNKHTRLHMAATPYASAAEAWWDGLAGCRSPIPMRARQARHLAKRH